MLLFFLCVGVSPGVHDAKRPHHRQRCVHGEPQFRISCSLVLPGVGQQKLRSLSNGRSSDTIQKRTKGGEGGQGGAHGAGDGRAAGRSRPVSGRPQKAAGRPPLRTHPSPVMAQYERRGGCPSRAPRARRDGGIRGPRAVLRDVSAGPDPRGNGGGQCPRGTPAHAPMRSAHRAGGALLVVSGSRRGTGSGHATTRLPIQREGHATGGVSKHVRESGSTEPPHSLAGSLLAPLAVASCRRDLVLNP